MEETTSTSSTNHDREARDFDDNLMLAIRDIKARIQRNEMPILSLRKLERLVHTNYRRLATQKIKMQQLREELRSTQLMLNVVYEWLYEERDRTHTLRETIDEIRSTTGNPTQPCTQCVQQADAANSTAKREI